MLSWWVYVSIVSLVHTKGFIRKEAAEWRWVEESLSSRASVVGPVWGIGWMRVHLWCD